MSIRDKLATYRPEDVLVIIAGFQMTGFVSGTFLSISKPNSTFSSRESADGVVARTQSNSKLYTVTLTLANTSDSNQLLSYMSRLDELTKIAKFPIAIKDMSGQSVLFSPEAWVDNTPDSNFSDSIEDRSWSITCANCVYNAGGNYEESGILQDVLNIGSGYSGGVV